MKRKRAISLLFILLANMVILAHAVVPHHHHNKIFASVVSLLDDGTQNELNHHNGETHHHDNSDNSEECLINEVCSAAFRIQDENSITQLPAHLDFDFPVLFTVDNFTESLFFRFFPFRQKPYLEFSHSVFITQSLGLRAPPCC